MNNDVTIAIPVWNVEQYVSAALESAAMQTYKNIRLMIVDDCGSDRSMEIVEKKIVELGVANRTDIIRHDKNKGLGEARNTAINNTTTDYLFFLDSDDEMTPKAIELLMTEALNTGADITMGSSKRINEDGTFRTTYGIYPKMVLTTPHAGIYLTAFAGPCHNSEAWGKIYKTSLLHNNNIHTIHPVLEDMMLWMQTAYYSSTIATIPNIVYKYRTRTDSICNNKSEWHTPERQQLLHKIRFDVLNFAKQHTCPGMNIVQDKMINVLSKKLLNK